LKEAEKIQAKVMAAAVAEARNENRRAAKTSKRLQIGINNTIVLYLRS
jgi:hypothetical protein